MTIRVVTEASLESLEHLERWGGIPASPGKDLVKIGMEQVACPRKWHPLVSGEAG